MVGKYQSLDNIDDSRIHKFYPWSSGTAPDVKAIKIEAEIFSTLQT